jgi:hypothetical protein
MTNVSNSGEKFMNYEFTREEIIQCKECNTVKPACLRVQFSTRLPVFPNLTMSKVQNEDFTLCSMWVCLERSAVTMVYRSMVRAMAKHSMA